MRDPNATQGMIREILESSRPRRGPPPSPLVVRSVASVEYVPYVPPPSAADNRLMVATALVAMLVGIPVAALAISIIY